MRVQLGRFLTIAAIGFLAACTFVTSASAQNAVGGSFTLSHEIRWQNAVLPAGDYTFALRSATRSTPMVVTGPNGSVFQLASVVSESKTNQRSMLILENRGGTSFVREMRLAEAGLDIRYSVPKIPRNEKELAQGPASTEQVLLAVAK